MVMRDKTTRELVDELVKRYNNTIWFSMVLTWIIYIVGAIVMTIFIIIQNTFGILCINESIYILIMISGLLSAFISIIIGYMLLIDKKTIMEEKE